MKIRDQVKEFHEVGGLPVIDRPTAPSEERIRLRLKLIAEEFIETGMALMPNFVSLRDAIMNAVDTMDISVDMVEFADGCGDLDYVVEGARLEFGINGEPVANEIHRSNMAKFGPDRKVKYRADGKILKPDDWTPPDIEKVLEEQGWILSTKPFVEPPFPASSTIPAPNPVQDSRDCLTQSQNKK